MVTPGVYRHYKGGTYKVIFAGTIMGTEGDSDGVAVDRVLYETLDESAEFPKGTVWRRSLDKFEELVVVDGREVPRFVRVDPHRPKLGIAGVRYAAPTDIDAINHIVRALSAEHQVGDPVLYELSLVSADQLNYAQTLTEALADHAAHVLVSVDEHDQVKGFLHCFTKKYPTDNVSPPGANLEIPFLAVAQDSRSEGHGARLLQAARRVAEITNSDQVRLRVWNFNTRAVKFYERNGFRAMRTEMIARPEWIKSGS